MLPRPQGRRRTRSPPRGSRARKGHHRWPLQDRPRSFPPPSPRASDSQVSGGCKPRDLHLFSGPSSRQDGISATFARIGWTCDDIDTVNSGSPQGLTNDLYSDTLWMLLQSRISSGWYDAVVAGPPCSTFSRARGYGGGPRPLRSADSPYGIPKHLLTTKEQLSLAEGNWLAISTANLLALAHAHKVSWIYETPEPVEEVASMLHLREFASLASLPGVTRKILTSACSGPLPQNPRPSCPSGLICRR